MSDKTSIEWADASWPVLTGCTHLSPGCDLCYSARLTSTRLRHLPEYAGLAENGRFNGTVRLLPERLDWPLKWRKPRRIFVSDMADLFHKDVPDEFIACVFTVMAKAPQHTFQVLTKRHARMRSLLSSEEFQAQCFFAAASRGWDLEGTPWPLPNVWLGVSVEDQKWADVRIPALVETPAAVRFLSCEPLLGEVMLHELYGHAPWSATEFGTLCMCGASMTRDGVNCHGNRISWVIAGGESGPGARSCELEWLRSLRDQCAETGTAFFLKQLGSVLGKELGAGPKGGDFEKFPEDLKVREFPRSSEAVPHA